MSPHGKLTAREGNGIHGEGRAMSHGLEILDEIRRIMPGSTMVDFPPPPPDDWATSTQLVPMLSYFVHAPVSPRKGRLFACACCRLLEPLLTDPRSRQAIDVGERLADGLVTLSEQVDARLGAFYATRVSHHAAARAAQFAVAEDIDLAVEEVIRCTILALWSTRRDEVQAMQC